MLSPIGKARVSCHVERKRNIAWKGKTYGLDITAIYCNIDSAVSNPSGRFFTTFRMTVNKQYVIAATHKGSRNDIQ